MGLEFDQVMLLDDSTLADTREARRLLRVAPTRTCGPCAVTNGRMCEEPKLDEWLTGVWEA